MYSLTDCTGLRVLGRRGVQTFGDCVHTQCHDGQHDVAKHKKACSDHANTPYHPRRPDSSQDHKVHTTFPPPTSEGNALRRCHLKQFNCSCMRDSSRTHAHSLHRTLWVTQSLDRQCTSFKCRPADHLQAASQPFVTTLSEKSRTCCPAANARVLGSSPPSLPRSEQQLTQSRCACGRAGTRAGCRARQRRQAPQWQTAWTAPAQPRRPAAPSPTAPAAPAPSNASQHGRRARATVRLEHTPSF